MAVSFTQGNDFIVPTEDGQTYLGGAGNDTYMLSAATIAADAVITITDTEGTNNIQLVGGLEITSSLVTSNALELTLERAQTLSLQAIEQLECLPDSPYKAHLKSLALIAARRTT